MAMDPLWILLLISCAVAKPLCPDECICTHRGSAGSIAVCHGALPHYSSFGVNLEHLQISDFKDEPFNLGPTYFSGSSYSTLGSVHIRNTSLISVEENTFASLSNLYELDLSENSNLREFNVNAISGANNLRILSLSGSGGLFANKSGPIFNSNHLHELDLSKCGITNLNKLTFMLLKGLTYLVLAYNGITSIQAGTFDHLTVLEDLDLSGNQISLLPSDMFAKTTELTVLRLRGNPLTAIPDSIFGYNGTALVEIDLSGTLLDHLAMPPMKELETLKLNGSSISSIDKLSMFPSLRNLNISGTSITTFDPDSFVGNPYLETLLLSGNPHLKLPKKISKKLPRLYLLDLSFCSIESLDPSFFSNLNQTATLNISHNDISDSVALGKALFSLSNLRVLDLSYNKLRTLERGDFQNKRGLTVLILRGNPLVTQPSIEDFPSLRRLDLSNCMLTRIHLPTIFLQGSKLKYVYLTDNNLFSLFDESLLDPEDYDNRWYPPEQLTVLELIGNPWACDPPFTSLLYVMIRKGVWPSTNAPPQLVKRGSPRDLDEEWRILERAACEPTYIETIETFNTEGTPVKSTVAVSAHLLVWSIIGIVVGMCLLLTLGLLKAFGFFAKKGGVIITPPSPPESGKSPVSFIVPATGSKKVRVKEYQRLHEDRSPGSPTTPRIYKPPPGTQFPYPELDVKGPEYDEKDEDYHKEAENNQNHSCA